jgi:hypothetical protein
MSATFAGLAAVFLATTLWLWLARPGGDYNIKLVVGLVTFFGTVLTVAASVIGLMLKDSVDRRTLGLRIEAESRLKTDTALTAVELMGAKRPEEGTPLQRAGALMALASLGHQRFALGLLDELWEAESVPTRSAVWLIDSCLVSPESGVQEEAADLLRRHADRLLSSEGRFLWPRGAFNVRGIKSLSQLAAFWSLEALLGCLTSRPYDEWDPEDLNEAYVLLDLFQANMNTRQSAAHAMKILMAYLLQQAPADSQSRKIYEGSLAEAEEILSEQLSADSGAGRMPFLLAKMQDQLRAALAKGSSSEALPTP